MNNEDSNNPANNNHPPNSQHSYPHAEQPSHSFLPLQTLYTRPPDTPSFHFSLPPPSQSSGHRDTNSVGSPVYRDPNTQSYSQYQQSGPNSAMMGRLTAPPDARSRYRQGWPHPPPDFSNVQLASLRGAHERSTSYSQPPSPPKISDEELPEGPLDPLARSQPPSDQENRPPPRRPQPRPLTRESADAGTTSSSRTSKRRTDDHDHPADKVIASKRQRALKPEPEFGEALIPSTNKGKASANPKSSRKSSAKPTPAPESDDDEDLIPSTKGKAPIRSKPAAKIKKKATARGGRKAGSTNYSTHEDQQLLYEVGDKLPIGGKSWDDVTNHYNKWAAASEFNERDRKSLKARFNTLVTHAKSKPTGVAERDPDHPFAVALRINDSINEKSGMLTLDDSEFEEGNEDSDASRDDDQPQVKKARDVIDISSDDAELPSTKPSKKGGLTAVAAKAYKVAPAGQEPRARRGAGMAAATSTLTAIGSVFNPDAMRERDDQRLTSSLHLTQLTALQTELRELRQRFDTLQDRLREESRRADRAETQLEILRANYQPRRHRSSRRSSYSSSMSSRSPSPSTAHRSRNNRHSHHSHHRDSRRRHSFSRRNGSVHHSPSIHHQSQSINYPDVVPQPNATPRSHATSSHTPNVTPIASSSRIQIEDLPSISAPPGVTLTITPNRGGSEGEYHVKVSSP